MTIRHNAKVRISIGFVFGFDSHFSSRRFLFVNFRKMFSFFCLLKNKQTNIYIFFFFCRVDSVAIWMDYIRCQKSQFHFFSPRTHFLFALYCRLLPTCFFFNFFSAQKCGHCTMKSICDKRKKGLSHKKNWIEMVECMATELN